MRLSNHLRRSIFCLASALFLSIAAAPAATSAQDDALDHVRRFPAEFVGRTTVELALSQLDWLHTRTKINSLRIAERQQVLEVEIERLFAKRTSLVESLPLEFRFADDRARSEAVSRCLQELLAVRLELATQHALSKEQARQPEDIQNLKHQLDLHTHDLLIRQKEAAVQQAELSLAHSTQLQEKGFVTPEQVRSDEFAVENARAELETEKLSFSFLAKEIETNRSREQTKTDREIRVFQAREQAAKAFLEQLNNAAISNQQIRRLDEEILVKRRELELLSEQQFERQREVDEMEILEKQVRADLKKYLASEAAAKQNQDPAEKD